MESPARDIARRLAEKAEAVCRHYLSNGRREGHYWMVGDAHNNAGRSLYVRLDTGGKSHPGKWTDAATGDHGDLLDIIAARGEYRTLRETLAEARRFLSLPTPAPSVPPRPRPHKASAGTPEAARRLWAASRAIAGTMASAYLGERGLVLRGGIEALRFHPRCYYRPSEEDASGTRQAWPAMIAAVTDLNGAVTGVHRTWLDPATADKAPLACPRRAMGHLLGHGVRFGAAGAVMAAGEGIETILSLRQILPGMPMIAGLSAAHLAAIRFPVPLRRLYVACDDDPAGAGASMTLIERAARLGIDILLLEPGLDDFNGDLRAFGREQLAATVAPQLVAADARRFLC